MLEVLRLTLKNWIIKNEKITKESVEIWISAFRFDLVANENRIKDPKWTNKPAKIKAKKPKDGIKKLNKPNKLLELFVSFLSIIWIGRILEEWNAWVKSTNLGSAW